jgi:hypothetical protein
VKIQLGHWCALPWLVLACAQAAGQSATAPSISTVSGQLAGAAFSRMVPGAVAPPWQVIGLPGQKLPLTQFNIQPSDGFSALRIQADGSYGNLVFDTAGLQLPPQVQLRWRWRLEHGLPGSDLRRKEGDDTPVKVCALFNMALDGMSFAEQARLRLARAMSGQPLPAATLCYVWDRLLPAGTILPNAFSPRVQYLVVTNGAPRPGEWVTLGRNLGEDFLRAFGHETRTLPPLIALAIGADADNTGGSSLALVGDLTLVQP